MPAMTLYEMAKGREPVTAAFIEVFADSTPLGNFIRYASAPSGVWKYNLEERMPGVAFRGINETYTPTTGVLNPQVEQTKAVGGVIEIDRKLITEQGEERADMERMMQVKNLAYRYSVAFIKGNADATFQREFDGLQKRLVGRQLVDNDAGTGAALSLAKLDDAISLVAEPDVIFMNRQMVNRMSQAMRNQDVAGNINFIPNTGPGMLQGFGQQVLTYNGLPVVDYGEDETGEDIIQFNEAAAGGGSTSTSIYVVSFQAGKVEGFQSNTPEVVEGVETGKATTIGTLLDWYTGLAVQHPKSAARVRGVTNGPITQ